MKFSKFLLLFSPEELTADEVQQIPATVQSGRVNSR